MEERRINAEEFCERIMKAVTEGKTFLRSIGDRDDTFHIWDVKKLYGCGIGKDRKDREPYIHFEYVGNVFDNYTIKGIESLVFREDEEDGDEFDIILKSGSGITITYIPV